ncbi:MAG: tetratricopeptide repeat protein [Acidobacteriota bacterium]|nr:tetratricopeptide repeat protein [Acidobacteriota bacterium]
MLYKARKYIGSFLLTGCVWCFYTPSASTAQPTKPANLKNQSIEQKLSEAGDALASSDLARAEKLVREVLAVAPRNVTAHSLAGIIADRKNDLAAAEKHFALAARLAPQAPETRNNYGAILVRLNRRAEAAREFTASLAANPNQPSALVNLGQIRIAENNLKAARELFEKVKAIAPDVEILRALILISLQLNEKTRAAEEFAEYAAVLKTVSISFTDSQANESLGKALLASDLLDEARQEFEYILARDAGNINALVLLSKVYLQRKDIRAAGKLLESAVARGLSDARIYAALADVYQSGGYMENAIPAMRLAIEKDPKNDFYRARYGLLLIDSKAPAAAIIRLSEALKEFPNSPRILLVLGIAQQMDGKLVEARNAFQRVLEIEPKSVPALAYMATSQVEQAQYSEAVKTYQRALAVEEKNAILHYLVADTLLKIPTSDTALIQKHLVRSVELDEKLGQAHIALGKLYARAEDWQKALAAFEKGVRYAPDSAEAHYQLGRTLARLKRTEESKAAFEKYKKLNETQTAQKEAGRQELVRRLANVQF